jgi:starch synthase
MVPGYRSLLGGREYPILARYDVPGASASVALRAGRLDSGVPIYLIDAPDCFDRDGNPYHAPDGQAWPDNARRFAVFGRMIARVAEGSAGIVWRPDVLHGNDWHAALAHAFVATVPDRPGTLFSIHNLAYQGQFSLAEFDALDLPPQWWSPDALEFYGRWSFMKAGLVYADRISTVSPQYAREILTPAHGCGLDGLLRRRAADLSGIINGADYDVWDPRHDPNIAAPYWLDDLGGKRRCKRALQEAFGLRVDPDAFVVGHIGRFTDQKGTDLILGALPRMLAQPRLQLVVLGSGERALEQALVHAALGSGGRVAVHVGYDELRAHQVEAGADAFLMPSRFEPCGLNQIYSLRYGTVPIVHATGGLVDTVVDATLAHLADGSATGIWFEHATVEGVEWAVRRAFELYQVAARWRALMIAGMRRDFGWPSAAQAYVALYRQLSYRRASRSATGSTRPR